jgi:hypothetical protein
VSPRGRCPGYDKCERVRAAVVVLILRPAGAASLTRKTRNGLPSITRATENSDKSTARVRQLPVNKLWHVSVMCRLSVMCRK